MKIKELFHQKKIKRCKEELAQYHSLLKEMSNNEKEQDTVDITNIVVISFPHEKVYANKILNQDKNIDTDYHQVSAIDYINIFYKKKVLSKKKEFGYPSIYYDEEGMPTPNIIGIETIYSVYPELKGYIPSKVPKSVLYQLYLNDNNINPKLLGKL